MSIRVMLIHVVFFSSVHELDNFSRSTKPVECCSADSLGDLCFQFDQTKIPTAEDILFGRRQDSNPGLQKADSKNRAKRNQGSTTEYRCLRARKIVNNFECDNEQLVFTIS